MSHRILQRVILSALGALSAVLSSVAAAQEAADEFDALLGADEAEPAQHQSTSSRLIEEIIVTAQKREESLQDVPISVQAFSAEALDARGIEDPKALQLAVPGMQYNLFAGYSLIYIRGVGTDAFIPSADASVATYIDNIYYPFGHSLAAALGAVERVEVLKGPQGTLFGRNSTGGAINIVTKRPGPELEGSVLITKENFDKLNVRVHANVPLLDSLAVSVSGLSYLEENYYDLADASPQEGLPDETSRAFQVKLGWTPFDSFSAVLGISYINTRGGLTMSLPAKDIKPLGRLLGVTEQPDFVTSEDAPVYIDTDAKVATADLKYQTSWFNTRLIGGRQEIDSPALADFDGSQQPLVSFESAGQFSDSTTGEFQVLSNAESWGSDWLEWIAGAFYIDSSAGFDPLLFSVEPGVLDFLSNPPPGGPLDALSGLTVPLIDGLGDISNALGLPLDQFLNNGVNLNLQGVLDTESTAFFFQTTVDLTDWMALTLGGRYQTETRKLTKSTVRLAPNPNDRDQVIPIFNFGQRKEDETNFSPKAVLEFNIFGDDLLYLSFARGFKSGTFNIVNVFVEGQFIEPEEVTTYELGYKGTLLDGAMRLNAAAFQNVIDNLQVQIISLTSGGATRFETADGARVRGAEVDLLWQLMPDSLPGLVLTAAGIWMKGVYTDFKNGSGFDEQTGLFFGGSGLLLGGGGGVLPGRDFTGNKLVRTPKFSGNLGLSYTFDLASGSIEIAADTYHNSGFFFSAQNKKGVEEKPYTLLNARLSYLYAPWNARVTVFGKNVTGAKHHLVVSDLDFGTAKLRAAPATYGVRISWDF